MRIIREFRAIALILAAFTFSAHAVPADVRAWDEGALGWADFVGEKPMSGRLLQLSAELVQDTRTLRANGMETISIEARAVMYPSQSYADSTMRDDAALRYLQTQFDLLELLRRRFQNELASGMTGIEADRRLTYYNNLYRSESERLAEYTDNGRDDARLQYEEYELRRALENIGDPSIPEVKPSPWKYGLFLGLGAGFPVGKPSDYFSGAFNFTFGMMASWRRIGLETSIAYGSPTIRDPYLCNSQYAGMNYYANVKNANRLEIAVHAGFAVIDNKRFTVQPFVGGMWTGYSWTSRPVHADDLGNLVMDGLQQKMDIGDFNLSFGMNIEWHFHSVVTSFPIFGGLREEYISSLRLTPYAARSAFSNVSHPLDGWEIGFMVSYSGVARALGIK